MFKGVCNYIPTIGLQVILDTTFINVTQFNNFLLQLYPTYGKLLCTLGVP